MMAMSGHCITTKHLFMCLAMAGLILAAAHDADVTDCENLDQGRLQHAAGRLANQQAAFQTAQKEHEAEMQQLRAEAETNLRSRDERFAKLNAELAELRQSEHAPGADAASQQTTLQSLIAPRGPEGPRHSVLGEAAELAAQKLSPEGKATVMKILNKEIESVTRVRAEVDAMKAANKELKGKLQAANTKLKKGNARQKEQVGTTFPAADEKEVKYQMAYPYIVTQKARPCTIWNKFCNDEAYLVKSVPVVQKAFGLRVNNPWQSSRGKTSLARLIDNMNDWLDTEPGSQCGGSRRRKKTRLLGASNEEKSGRRRRKTKKKTADKEAKAAGDKKKKKKKKADKSKSGAEGMASQSLNFPYDRQQAEAKKEKTKWFTLEASYVGHASKWQSHSPDLLKPPTLEPLPKESGDMASAILQGKLENPNSPNQSTCKARVIARVVVCANHVELAGCGADQKKKKTGKIKKYLCRHGIMHSDVTVEPMGSRDSIRDCASWLTLADVVARAALANAATAYGRGRAECYAKNKELWDPVSGTKFRHCAAKRGKAYKRCMAPSCQAKGTCKCMAKGKCGVRCG